MAEAQAAGEVRKGREMEQIRMPVLPDEIEQLAEAVFDGIDSGDCYVEKEGGGFVLSDAARRQIAACNEDLAKQEAEATAKLAERDAKIKRLNGSARDLAASGAIREALLDCGVKAKAASMALPYLAKTLKIEVDDSCTATVNGTERRERRRRVGLPLNRARSFCPSSQPQARLHRPSSRCAERIKGLRSLPGEPHSPPLARRTRKPAFNQ